jgi:serine/threonine-protein kinase
MPLAPAFRLGPYEVVELLSAGSMGEVYRARDTRLGRQVAVKVLPAALADDRDRLDRFEREAQAAGALNHPNIVAVFDVGRDAGISFVVSELVDGMTLRDRARSGPLGQGAALDYAAQIACGLGAAHISGIVHRDLKPDNVMVTRDGRVKIVDFGIAKIQASFESGRDGPSGATMSRTLPGTLVGTVAYMSPEQVRGEDVDHRSDIFSLGVILYELLSGRHPFGGPTVADTISAILRDEAAPLRDVDKPVEAIVRRALDKSREARFQSALEMAEAIDAFARPRGGARGVYSTPPDDATRAARTIAVLPFLNVNSEPESEYFSDGLTEELIQALTRVNGLQVVAWHSASQMKGRGQDAQAIGRELKVTTVLAGSVRKAGDRVRIAVRLVEVASGYFLWSETYDRQVQDVFAIQEEIARAIVGTLTETLVGIRVPAVSVRGPGNLEAYNLYLKGRFFWNKRTSDGLHRSVELFQRAVAADEDFALAHAGLADAYCLLADYGLAHPTDAMPRARAAALHALELDPRSAEAHVSFGLIRCVYDWEWLEGEALFRRALELNPGYATAHHWFGVDVLAMLGRFDEAAEHLQRAGRLDPLSLIIHEGKAYLLTMTRRYDEAIAAYQGLVELEPTFYKAYTSMGRAYIHKGMYPEAIEMLQKGRALAGDIPSILGALGQVYALAGDRSEARQVLGQLEEISTRQHVPSTTFALVNAGLAEYGRALDWLERGCAQHELPLTALKVHPGYDALRDQPRFAALLRRMRLT